MDLERYIFPSKSSFVLKTSEAPDSVKMKLVQIGLSPDEELKESTVSNTETKIQGKIAKSQLELKEESNFFETLFRPRLLGTIEEDENGAKLHFTSKPGVLISYLMEQSGGALAGAVIALGASVYLSPNIIPLIYTIIISVMVPLIFVTTIVLISRVTSGGSLDRVRQTLEKTLNSKISEISPDVSSETAQEIEVLSTASSTPLQKLKAGIIAALVFLTLAFGLHQIAYQFWKNGDYKTSEKLCHPVSTLTKAFLNDDSAVVADTEYYLAECLRCQGKLAEAKKLYLKVLELYENDIGADHQFVADVTFNLGRIHEAEKDFDSARTMYMRSLKIWSSSIGSSNILTNRIRDRLAILSLKEGKTNSVKVAKKLLEKALKFDRRYKPKVGDIAVAEDLNDLAVTAYYEGDYKSAGEKLKSSIALLEKRAGTTSDKLAAPLINLIYTNLKSGTSTKDQTKLLLKRLNKILDTDLSIEDLRTEEKSVPRELLTAFKRVLKKQRPSYEAPTYDTRANVIITLDGRL